MNYKSNDLHYSFLVKDTKFLAPNVDIQINQINSIINKIVRFHFKILEISVFFMKICHELQTSKINQDMHLINFV